MISFSFMVKLFFAGIKHSGKSTFARLVAESLSLSFADSDDLVLERIKSDSIRSFYREYGKERFMEEEYLAIKDYCGNNAVIALGGGASDNDRLLSLIKEEGKLIYLKRREEDMLPVILKDGIPPFLDKDNPEKSFHELYARRDRIYSENADLTIELGPYGDKGKTLELILTKLKESGYGL